MGKARYTFLLSISSTPVYSALQFQYEEMAKKRTIGTFVGAFWGTNSHFLTICITGKSPCEIEESFAKYMLISLFTGIVLYSTVVLNCKKSSYFSCIFKHYNNAHHRSESYPFCRKPSTRTLIGIGLAIIVSSVHLPRQKNNDILFVSGIDDTAF